MLSAAGVHDLEIVHTGRFSPALRQCAGAVTPILPDIDSVIRHNAQLIVYQNDGFTPVFDGPSIQFYDLIYWMYSHIASARSLKDFLAGGEMSFRGMLPDSARANDGEFSVRSVNDSFLQIWRDNRVSHSLIIPTKTGFTPSKEFEPWVLSWISPSMKGPAKEQ